MKPMDYSFAASLLCGARVASRRQRRDAFLV